MSRKSTLWKKKVGQAKGEINKIIPHQATGKGEYLTKSDLPTYPPKVGTGRGTVCTAPMKSETEARVRRYGK